MVNTAPTSSLQSVVPSEEVATKRPLITASCLDPAYAAPMATAAKSLDLDTASNKSTCAASDSALNASTETMYRLVTTVSSDESAAEATSASRDDPAIEQDNVPQKIVHPISASTNTDGIVGDITGVSHNIAAAAEASSDHFFAAALEQSIQAAAKNDSTDDTFVTTPVSTEDGEVVALIHHPQATGEAHTAAPEAVDPPRAISAGLAIHEEVGGSMTMTKRIEDASNVAKAPIEGEGENNADQEASAKKRKIEDEPSNKDQPTKQKARVLKDPNAPKKNMTAYMHYATYARAWIKSRNPNAAIATEVTKAVKDGWKDISDHGRLYWNEQAIGDKARYEKELAEYKNSELDKVWQAYVAAEESKQEQATSNSAIDANEGKKQAEDLTSSAKPAETVFMNYDTYARTYITSRHPQMEDIVVAMVIQSGWNVLSPDVRDYWDRVALADQLEYVERCSFYQRFALTVQEIVEAKVSTQDILDYLCLGL